MFYVTRNFLHSYTGIYTYLNAQTHTHIRMDRIQMWDSCLSSCLMSFTVLHVYAHIHVFSLYMLLYLYTCSYINIYIYSYINKYIYRVPFTPFFSLLIVHRKHFHLFIAVDSPEPLLSLMNRTFFNCLNNVNIKLYYCLVYFFFHLHLNSRATSLIPLQMGKQYIWQCFCDGFVTTTRFFKLC